MRARIVNIVKLLLAAALVFYVLSQVDLHDKYTVYNKDKVVLSEQPVDILGKWDRGVVDVKKADGTTIQVEPGVKAGGNIHELRPGLVTLVKSMDVGVFVLGALAYFFVVAFSGWRWWWLLRMNELVITCGQAIRLTWIGVFFNNVVPGLTGGDVVKAVYIARITGEKTRPIVSVLVDRFVGLIALALLAALAVLFHLDDPEVRTVAVGIYIGLGVLVLAAIAFFSRRMRALLHLDKLLRKLPLAALLSQIERAIYFYRGHLKGVLVLLSLSMINHVVGIIGIVLIGKALHVGMPWTNYLFLIPIINIASAAPIAPSGWGVGEWLFKTLFAMFRPEGISAAAMATRSVALSVLYRIHLMGWSLLGAMFLAVERGKRAEAGGEAVEPGPQAESA